MAPMTPWIMNNLLSVSCSFALIYQLGTGFTCRFLSQKFSSLWPIIFMEMFSGTFLVAISVKYTGEITLYQILRTCFSITFHYEKFGLLYQSSILQSSCVLPLPSPWPFYSSSPSKSSIWTLVPSVVLMRALLLWVSSKCEGEAKSITHKAKCNYMLFTSICMWSNPILPRNELLGLCSILLPL